MARSGLQISDLVMFGVYNLKNELSPSSGGVGRPSAAYYDQELTIQVDWTTFWEVSERPNTSTMAERGPKLMTETSFFVKKGTFCRLDLTFGSEI